MEDPDHNYTSTLPLHGVSRTGNNVLIIIDSLDQWDPYYSSESIISSDVYLQNDHFSTLSHLVINLCSDTSYLSEGYYCSLLAQARRHRVLPSIETLQRIESDMVPKVDAGLLFRCGCICEHNGMSEGSEYQLDLYFGKPEDPAFNKIGRAIFEQYPAPLLRVTLNPALPHQILGVRSLSLTELDDHQQDLFAHNLDMFSRKIWRNPRGKKPYRYDLAILHDPNDPLPPSNRRALNLFLGEARKMDINAELLTEDDSGRLLEFDALFIRQTTAVDNITYSMANAAEQADMVVIDDPSSIIRCTNKVYLKEFLDTKGFPTPKSNLLFCKTPPPYEELTKDLGQQMVLKIPDGSFSVGIHKVENEKKYFEVVDHLSERSSVLLAQEFVPTEYDWRIGVLNGEAIFACKYYMARGHWQIYRHTSNGGVRSGKFETFPVHLVSRRITRMAERAASSIGKGFYGVDLKETACGVVIIEINDNPSVDHGVEDMILGAELYRIILREFISRLDAKGKK